MFAINKAGNTVDIKINNVQGKAIIDSGAAVSIISKDFVDNHKLKVLAFNGTGYKLANGKLYKPLGQCKIKLNLMLEQKTKECELNIFVCDGLPVDVLIGFNLIKEFGIIIDGSQDRIYFS